MRNHFTAFAFFAAASATQAAVSFTGAPYFQDFNSLGIGPVTWADNTTLAGWYAHQSATSGAPSQLDEPLATGANSGGNTTGSKGHWFNFGRASTDRALGVSPDTSKTGHTSWGMALTNNTGGTLSRFTLAFDWEKWFHADTGSSQDTTFSWSTDATSLTSGTWTSVPTATLTLVPTAPANVWFEAPVVFSREFTAGFSWEAGTDLWLRWENPNALGGDHGTGINNVSFSADNELVPTPAVTLLAGPWSGAVTTTTAVVNFKMNTPDSGVRLAVSALEDFAESQFFIPAASHETLLMASVAVSGLSPNTLYHYAVETNGSLDLDRRGTFRTFPAAPGSFTFAFRPAPTRDLAIRCSTTLPRPTRCFSSMSEISTTGTSTQTTRRVFAMRLTRLSLPPPSWRSTARSLWPTSGMTMITDPMIPTRTRPASQPRCRFTGNISRTILLSTRVPKRR